MNQHSFLKLNLFSCLYGFLLFALTMMLFRPYQVAAIVHVTPEEISGGFFWVAILAAVIYMMFMNRFARQRPKNWKEALGIALYAVLWFPYWLLFVFIAFLIRF
ncbi:MAG: hypothetical protein ABF629_05090 [Sporolactobacillus sp.]|uniref:hypothetical protein n=1 Tax=Sporolactobacillus sp. STSJ-5 TaxID=2965076 RepID=UPI0021071D3F|nr:hypothetical protein [Sporolactobacillus sp. STSJ-5]MCQ2011105.1 hypothetical protein [Sporolactobacillus sp. STSJ-5]